MVNAMEISQILAENLKAIRAQQNLSLGQLAERSGMSKVMLAQLEKGDSNPTINTILKIANALNVPYMTLLNSTGSSAVVVSKKDLPLQSSGDGHCRAYCYYAGSAERSFEWYQMEIDPGYDYMSIGHSGRVLEYVVVQSGDMTMVVNGTRYELHAGDSISFQAAEEHHYINPGTETTYASSLVYYLP